MNCKSLSSCYESTIEINFLIQVELDQDDIGKLKTTACSNDENNQVSQKNIIIFIDIMNGSIISSQDFLYICQESVQFEKKVELNDLDNEKIIKLKNNEKKLKVSSFEGSGIYQIKNMISNEM